MLHEDSGYNHVSAAVNPVREALSIVRGEIDRNEMQCGYQALLSETTIERPRFNIPRNQLAFLLEGRFTVPSSAAMLRVSVRTIRRRMTEYNLSVHMMYPTLSDSELDEIVGEIQHQFPTCGNQQMQGHLLAQGIGCNSRELENLNDALTLRAP